MKTLDYPLRQECHVYCVGDDEKASKREDKKERKRKHLNISCEKKISNTKITYD